MADEVGRQPARDLQELEWLLLSRQRAGDVDGMAALFEIDAVIDVGDGRFIRGKESIREFFCRTGC